MLRSKTRVLSMIIVAVISLSILIQPAYAKNPPPDRIDFQTDKISHDVSINKKQSILQLKEQSLSSSTGTIINPEGQLGGYVSSLAINDSAIFAGEGASIVALNKTDLTAIGRLKMPGIVEDVKLSGTNLFVATGTYLEIINVSNPLTMTKTGEFNWYNPIISLFVSGNSAFVGSYGRVSIIDISNPSLPLNRFNISTVQAQSIFAQGNLVYIVGSQGLTIVDIANAASPILKSQLKIGDYSYGVTVNGSYAYVANHRDGLAIVNISNPATPVLVGQFSTLFTQDVQIVGNFAYLANDYVNGVQVVDISDPANPVQVGNTYYTRGEAMAIKIVGNLAYIADGSSGVDLLDVSNLNSISLAASYDTPGFIWGIDVAGNYAYLANYESGFSITDITDPAHPILKGSFDTNCEAFGIDVSNGIAYVGDDCGLQVVDVSNPSNPQNLAYLNINGDTDSVKVVGNRVYTTSGSTGLHIIDVLTPNNPKELGNYIPITSDGWAMTVGLDIVNSIVYLADERGGLYILDVTDPTQISLLSKLEVKNARWNNVKVKGDIAFLTGQNGLSLIDVGDPSVPLLLGTCQGVYTEGVDLISSFAMISSQATGISIIDVSNPFSPMVIDTVKGYGGPRDLRISGNNVFAAAMFNGLETYQFVLPPSLVLNHVSGSTGSSILVTGHNFQPLATISILISGKDFATTVSDTNGDFEILLTTDLADKGLYLITASSVNPQSSSALQAFSVSATAWFRLIIDAPIYPSPETPPQYVYPIPTGYAMHQIYLPEIVR